MHACRMDMVHWFNNWAWTYDPREAYTSIPFDLFPRQKEFLHWLADREAKKENGLADKARDSGLTYLCCGYALHGWLFRPGYQVGFGSRKLEYVDKNGDPKCIFEKLRFLFHNLPPWMKPARFRPHKHNGYCKLINPANGACITGEGGEEMGRGGRSSIYFVDEAAYIERPEPIERSLSQTTRVRIDISTPNGPGNPFATKRFSGRIPVFSFQWSDDPRKSEAWLAEQKRIHDPVTVAQEILIDYSCSVEGITIPAAWVRAAVDLQIEASGPVIAGLDVAEGGKDQSVLITRQGPVVAMPLSWGNCNTTETAHRAANEAERRGATVMNYDATGVGAGIRGTYESSERPLSFTANAINNGESPSETRWPDGKTSKERFLNLRAESWWLLRVRFEKAYEFREQGILHPAEDMISIPNHQQLIADLSLPLHFYTETGKIKLESKADMRRRGVKSPDFGDALALCFYTTFKRKAMVW